MNQREVIYAKGLIAEVERYLAVVAVFRAEGCERTWRPDAARFSAFRPGIAPGLRTPAAH
jgi:hypothetical protein